MNTILPQTRNSVKRKHFFFLLLLGLSFFPHCCSALTALILPCIFFSRRASLYCFPLHISAVTVPALCLSFYHLLTKSKQKEESFQFVFRFATITQLYVDDYVSTSFCIVFFYRHVVTPKPNHPTLLTKTWNLLSNSQSGSFQQQKHATTT